MFIYTTTQGIIQEALDLQPTAPELKLNKSHWWQQEVHSAIVALVSRRKKISNVASIPSSQHDDDSLGIIKCCALGWQVANNLKIALC